MCSRTPDEGRVVVRAKTVRQFLASESTVPSARWMSMNMLRLGYALLLKPHEFLFSTPDRSELEISVVRAPLLLWQTLPYIAQLTERHSYCDSEWGTASGG